MSRIATGGGDEGETSLFGGERVSKDHAAVEAYGAVDELNAYLGLCHAASDDAGRAWLQRVQNELFAIGAELATPGGGKTRVDEGAVERLDEELDTMEAGLSELKNFVLPTGGELAARFHVARTVCRRAERRVIAMHRDADEVRREVRVYLNRLADLLFLKAREAALAGDGEVAVELGAFRDA